jgi:hypothetical protein
MHPHMGYLLWTQGNTSVTATISLDSAKQYVVTGGLTLTDGDDYAHVYIARVCYAASGDAVQCGVRDTDGDAEVGLVEFLSGARDVTVKLRSTGGRHTAEVMIYEL